jgi:hypothetical protein
MLETNVNLLAVLVAAIANMALGFLWYSPVLFGKQWMSLMGLTAKNMAEAKKKMGMLYVLSFVATLITGYVLAVMTQTTQVLTVLEGLQLGALLWIGFIGPVQFTDVVFAGRPWKLYLINTGYQFIAMLVMSTILVLWV